MSHLRREIFPSVDNDHAPIEIWFRVHRQIRQYPSATAGGNLFPSVKSFEGCGAAPFRPIPIMQSPSAHIAAQGKTPIIRGATPMATSQLQLKARPATIASGCDGQEPPPAAEIATDRLDRARFG